MSVPTRNTAQAIPPSYRRGNQARSATAADTTKTTTPAARIKNVKATPPPHGAHETQKVTSTAEPIRSRRVLPSSKAATPFSAGERSRKKNFPVAGPSSKPSNESSVRTQSRSNETSECTLGVAAQSLAWRYMISTLDECHRTTETRILQQLEERSEELAREEEDIADARVRFKVERLLDFYDEISDEKHVHEVPKLMGAFLRHENACQEAIGVALGMNADARMDAEQLSHCSSLLDLFGANPRLGDSRLQYEGSQLVTLMSNVAGTPASPRPSQLSQTMAALAGLVQSRVNNLADAQSLVESYRTNLRLHLEIESLRITS